MGFLKRASKACLKAKLRTLLRLGMLGRPYHPINHIGWSGTRSQRVQGTLQRWDAIKNFLADREPSSILDIGCNIGFFTLELAKRGHFCLGVDINKRALLTANLIREIDEIEQACFMHFPINIETVGRLPAFDITICLSVFHHWAMHFGADEATAIMQEVADQTNDLLFFETAQTSDCSEKYQKVLPDMGSNARAWLDSYLTDLGFSEVFSLGAYAVGGAGGGSRELMVGLKRDA